MPSASSSSRWAVHPGAVRPAALTTRWLGIPAGAAAIGAVLQIKPLLKIEGELLDACAKVRGTAGCKKKLLETIRGDAERLSAKWDIDIAVAGSDERVPGARRHLRRSAFLQRQQPCGAGRLRYGCEPPPGPDEGRDLIR